MTARGLNGWPFAQSFSNKLLVLIDGRTVYSPLFSGVYWDMQDVLPDDIDQIEVISGPGATLWGANAVNGVINIITRSAASSSGVYAQADAGTNEQVVGARVAGEAGKSLSYRAYGRFVHEDAFELLSGGSAHDPWHRLGGGFRLDWTPGPKDLVTLQGDIFTAKEDQGVGAWEDVSGHDIVVRWNRDSGVDRHLQVQAFWDQARRATEPHNGHFLVDTYDFDLQESLPVGHRNQIVWGGGARIAHYRIGGTPSFFFEPNSRNLLLANAFISEHVRSIPWAQPDGGAQGGARSLCRDQPASRCPACSEAVKLTLVWAASRACDRRPPSTRMCTRPCRA